MSWTPDFWIRESDYKKIEQKINDWTEQEDGDFIQAWKFDVGVEKGVVISCGETTRAHRDIHKVIIQNEIPHWLLSGEEAECVDCNEWGEEVV